jgi:hypothetical protein
MAADTRAGASDARTPHIWIEVLYFGDTTSPIGSHMDRVIRPVHHVQRGALPQWDCDSLDQARSASATRR